ncbi:hypothetical protein KBB96_08740 [Luteolibacter ambystomatis]|uniref:DUF155 domain-containing protein n=1 Tax=Luteolibacter ambystomatis TaxID=2824561 RepID=A0A975J2Q3_9BACT|nr:hypothetical protein [Luteolibacter ambystomatis]QUE52965.1 hypothetical protein KBB96_08740 [Luteolibacter ambystomatis]
MPVDDPTAVLKGEVVFFHAFDVAYELKRGDLKTLLGKPLVPHQPGVSKGSPRQQLFYLPRMAQLDPVTLRTPLGDATAQRIVKVLPIGAVSITLRVPFAVAALEGLIPFHHPAFAEGVIKAHALVLAEQLRKELAPSAVRPAEELPEGEDYQVYCLETPDEAFHSEEWFRLHRRTIAALVTQESEPQRLSHQEARESTSRYLTYYQSDLVVADWDAALVVDRPGDFEETLYAMELANLQLEELIAYDRIIDAALEKSYADLMKPPKSSRRKGLLPHLREVRIDLARFSDEISNITKFFGDWHLARLYDTMSKRFHLADWHRTIDDKLKTLDDLYEMLKQEHNHRVMLVLEASIVLMFVIDIVLLLTELGKRWH